MGCSERKSIDDVISNPQLTGGYAQSAFSKVISAQ